MSPEPTLTDREEKIERIYEVIGYNEYIEDMMRRLSDYEAHHKTVMIGDVLDWVYHSYDKGKSVYEVFNKLAPDWTNMRQPIEKQTSECIDYIYSLIASTK